jgi:hypothetical protein
MNFIKKEQFISFFIHGKKTTTLSSFLKLAKVRNGKRDIVPLKTYAESNGIPNKDLMDLFENIRIREAYLERFYDTSLSIPSNFDIRDAPMKSGEMNNNQFVNYKNVIRNMFYREILQDTTSGIQGSPSFLTVIDELYNHWIIDYKIITPSARFYIREGRIGSVFSSFYFRASIMNPYLVYSLNTSVLKGTRIFTPTLGWCSYCYGFLECPGVVEYVGTDVIPKVCNTTRKFATKYYPEKTVDIFCEPSEDLRKSAAFMRKYREHFDVVFFSPPYYDLEQYPGTKQSTNRYDSYEEWLMEYWEKTIQLCLHVLADGGKLCYIISGYGSENTGRKYDLIEDMNTITKKYFKFHSMQNMYNKNVNSTNHRKTNEQIVLFRKIKK